jgi:membrane protease YdiL (CAAX protease family)
MPLTKIALYRASLLADNLGIRLCAAAVMVMPSALVFLLPILALLGAPDDALPAGPLHDMHGTWALLSLALGVGFTAAWLRIVFTGGRLLRRRGMRLFVTAGLALGIVASLLELSMLPGASARDDAGWLLLASLAVCVFLLAGTHGQPRTDRLHRV